MGSSSCEAKSPGEAATCFRPHLQSTVQIQREGSRRHVCCRGKKNNSEQEMKTRTDVGGEQKEWQQQRGEGGKEKANWGSGRTGAVSTGGGRELQ